MQHNPSAKNVKPDKNLKAKELLCMSLPFVKSVEHLDNKAQVIVKHSQDQNYLPLSLVELSLIQDK